MSKTEKKRGSLVAWLNPEETSTNYYSEAGKRSCALVGACATLAVGAILSTPGGPVFDPFACVAAVYVLFIFSVQIFVCDFSHADGVHVTLVASAFLVLLAPTMLHAIGLWETLRNPAVACALALMVVTYRYMVMGCKYVPAAGSLKGKVCIITGCNTGIGYNVAESLAKAGGHVIFACRSESRAQAAMDKVQRSSGVAKEQLRFLQLDTSSLKSVRTFAEKFLESGLDLHVLVLNAGVILTKRDVSEDGFDMTHATNYLGHFLLVNLLLPKLLEQEKKGGWVPRIVQCTSSFTHFVGAFDFSIIHQAKSEEERTELMSRPHVSITNYANSKLASLFMQNELNRRLRAKGSKIPFNAVNPGECLTDIQRNMHGVILVLHAIFNRFALSFMKSASQGSYGLVHASVAPEFATSDDMTDQLLYHSQPAITVGAAWKRPEEAAKLWELSRQLTRAPEL